MLAHKTFSPQTHDIYRRIIVTAGSIAQATVPADECPGVSSDSDIPKSTYTPEFSLPREPQIREALIDDGVYKEAADRLASLYARITSDFRFRLQEGFRRAWEKVAPLPRREHEMLSLDELAQQLMKTFRHVYEGKLKEWANDIRNSAKVNLAALSTSPSNSDQCKYSAKRPFNHSYLHILEEYFAKNRRPNRTEKQLLASKTRMSYRQIHVWFQNRRARSVKIQPLEHDRAVSIVRMATQPLSVISERNGLSRTGSSPSHAYPATYPPNIAFGEDPFPCRSGDFSYFMKPRWERKPASISNMQQLTDLDTLTCAFERLRIRDRSDVSSEGTTRQTTKYRTERHRISKSSCDFIPPYVYCPLRAPLKSLVRDLPKHETNHDDLSPPGNGSRKSMQPEVVDTHKAEHCTRSRMRNAGRLLPVSSQKHSSKTVESSVTVTHSNNNSLYFDHSSETSGSVSSICQLLKARKSTRKLTCRKDVAESKPKREDRRSTSAGPTQHCPKLSEPHSSHASSLDSLPTLSYSSSSSSSSECSQSPTITVVPLPALPEDSHLSSFDAFDLSGRYTSLPYLGKYLMQPTTSPLASHDTTFGLSKGAVDLTFNPEFFSCPSYSESFDCSLQGLQSSPDFAPPALTFDLPAFTT